MRVGFVGLGAMGMHMARNLQKAGLLSGLYNRTAAKAARPRRRTQGHRLPVARAELGAAVDAVVSCVSADADVLEVARALAPGLRRGALVLDCSTIGAESARQAADLLRPGGVEFLDCPVSGGVEGARDATLAIMVGGTSRGLRAGPADPAGPGQDRRALWPHRQRPGGQGHQPDHVRGHHRGHRRGHGLRARPGTAARHS